LQLGTYKTIFTDDGNGILIFERKYKRETIFVVINNGEYEYQLDAKTLGNGEFVDLISEKIFEDKIQIDAKWGAIIK